MSSYNRVILIGNLTRDPQLSYTPSNTAVCEFGMAVNERRKDRDGNMRDETCFVDCQLYGRSAEVFAQYMAKGRQVLIEGRLRFDQWTTPEGAKRSKHRVIVDNFQFLGGRGEAGAGGDPGAVSQQPSQGQPSGGYGGQGRPAPPAPPPSYAPPPSAPPDRGYPPPSPPEGLPDEEPPF